MAALPELTLQNMLTAVARRRATSIHVTPGSPVMIRVDGALVELDEQSIVTKEFVDQVINTVLTPEQRQHLTEQKTLVVTLNLADRFRVKAQFFFQRGVLAITMRLIPEKIPALASLGLPKVVYGLLEKLSGLVVVSGPYGSGRTTTIAALLDEINHTRKENILTIERPIEYVFTNTQSLVDQREVGTDVNSFVDGLQAAAESDVDIISVSGLNDSSSIPLIVEFANSGGLAFLESDATTVAAAMDELLASFPPPERGRAPTLLAEGLLAIICQRLVPRVGGGLVLAAEILVANDAVRALLREGRTQQLATVLQSSRAEGMMTLDQSLAGLVKAGVVQPEHAAEYASNPTLLQSMLQR